jgi:uncharacterized protein (TIGR02246 family)
MRKRYGFLLTILALVFWMGYVAQGQIRDKAPDPAKKGTEPATKDTPKPAGTAPPKATEAAKTDAQTNKVGSAKPKIDPDEEAIRAGAETYAKLYNAHDSKGLAQLFTPKAETIDEDDNLIKGRDAIEAAFKGVFEQHPESSMTIEVDSVRVLTPSLAIEEGTTRSKHSPDDIETVLTYVAIQAKIDGKWLLVSVHDYDAPETELTPHERLEINLSWLIGEWVDEGADSNIHTVCHWDESGNFLVQEFEVNIGGENARSGTTRIGWNGVTKQFQSWVFGSDGGHATGSWVLDGDRWIIKAQGATAKGEVGSSTNYYRLIDADTIAWGSFNRVLDGESLDDAPEVIVKRKPPKPTE